MTAIQLHQQAAEGPRIPQPRGEVRVYELELVAVPSAITCARLLVGYAAIKWQLARACEEELGDVAEALVRQALGAEKREREVLNYLAFRLRLVPRAVVVEVWDSSREIPRSLPSTAANDAGYDFLGGGRRVMWCAVNTRLAQDASGLNTPAGIPRRERLQGPTRASVAMQDPQLLQRVLSGLKELDSGKGSSASPRS